MEKNQKWDIFEDMTAKCYKTLDDENNMKECWYGAFDTLLEIIEEEKEKYAGCFKELAELDQATEFKYRIVGWVDDYFKELIALKDYDRMYKDGIRLLDAFQWEEQSAAQIKMRVVNAMERLGMHDAADKYSQEWIGQETSDMGAVLAELISEKKEVG